MDENLRTLIVWIASKGFRPLGASPLLYPPEMRGPEQVVDSIELLRKIAEIHGLDVSEVYTMANEFLDERETGHDGT